MYTSFSDTIPVQLNIKNNDDHHDTTEDAAVYICDDKTAPGCQLSSILSPPGALLTSCFNPDQYYVDYQVIMADMDQIQCLDVGR